MIRLTLSLAALALFAMSASAQNSSPRVMPPGNDFVKALSFAQHFASPAAMAAGNDRSLKAKILAALNEKPPEISYDEVSELFDRQEFTQWAGLEKKLAPALIEKMLTSSVPASRREISPTACGHVDLLSTQLDMIDEPHQRAADELARWIAKNYTADKPLGVSVICTGNSRRSVMGAVMGNVAAAYWGLPNVKFHSGGTSPSAFNPRTIKALEEIGIKVASTGQEAPRGKAGDPNPIYQVLWGERIGMQEFSKLYSHSENPQQDFAAILVCDEAEEACPTVAGATIRIAAPYFDPKAYDNTSLETSKYAERRDDIGRMMVSALMQARRQVQVKAK